MNGTRTCTLPPMITQPYWSDCFSTLNWVIVSKSPFPRVVKIRNQLVTERGNEWRSELARERGKGRGNLTTMNDNRKKKKTKPDRHGHRLLGPMCPSFPRLAGETADGQVAAALARLSLPEREFIVQAVRVRFKHFHGPLDLSPSHPFLSLFLL